MKLKRALADADRAGARRIYLLGPEELARGVVLVRDLASGEQTRGAAGDASAASRARVADASRARDRDVSSLQCGRAFSRGSVRRMHGWTIRDSLELYNVSRRGARASSP